MRAAAALAAAVFAPTALLCGFYLDDYSFLRDLQGVSGHALWRAFIEYVPGRNLHIPFLWTAIAATRGSAFCLHLISVAFDAGLATLAYRLALRTTGRRSVALAAAAMFVLMPNHGETHFWVTLIAQCQVPLLLTLGAFLLAFESRLWAALGLYAIALFTYDQVFFLWPLLLAAAWSADRSVRPARYAGAAAAGLALNVAHLSVRYLSPFAGGGRPVIRTGDVLRRCLDASRSLLSGTFPWPSTPKAPVWAIVVAGFLALGAAWWWVRQVRDAAAGEEERQSGLLRAALFGFAWASLAFVPNLFWFVSPRHGLIPSVGWAIAVCSLGALAVARWPILRRAAPALGILWFAMAAVADVCEGTQWVRSARMRDEFAATVRDLTPPVDNVFLIGAPRHMRRAPGFNLYHDVALAAGRAIGNKNLTIGDYTITPTRRGLVFFNDLTTWGPDQFRWIAGKEANLIVWSGPGGDWGSFGCVQGPYEPPLRKNPNCPSGGVMSPQFNVLLVESKPTGGSHAEKLTLVLADVKNVVPDRLSVKLAVISDRDIGLATRLTLDWRGPLPKGPIALVPRLLAADGHVLLDTVFAEETKAKEPLLVPLVDDLTWERPASAGVRQIFDIAKPLPYGAKRIEIDAYEVGPTFAPRLLGRFSAPLESKTRDD